MLPVPFFGWVALELGSAKPPEVYIGVCFECSSIFPTTFANWLKRLALLRQSCCRMPWYCHVAHSSIER